MGLAAAVAACSLCLLAPPADAAWEEVGATIRNADPGFGGFDLKRIGGKLYTAVAEGGNVYLYRLDGDGNWAFLNRVNERPAGRASLAEGPGGVPWIAWTEDDADGVAQVRAGWLDPSGHYWHEPDDRHWSINYHDPEVYASSNQFYAASPRLVFLGDRPYITFLNDNGVEFDLFVVRLAQSGDAWERIGRGLLSWIPHSPDAAVIDGLLNIGVTDGWDFATAGRLSQAGQWEDFGNANASIKDSGGYDVWGGFDGLAGFGGETHVLWTTEGYDANPEQVMVSKHTNDGWHVVGGPVADAPWGQSIRQIGGRLYVAWIDGGANPELHVSVLAADGSSWSEIGGPVGHPVSGGALLLGVDGVPYIEFTESNGNGATVKVVRLTDAPAPIGPDETGSGPGEDPPVKATLILPPREQPEPPDPPDDPDPPVVDDVCGPRIAGTSRGDRLAGTGAADTIRGLGGNDTLTGGRAFDCLFGGLGEDTLAGGLGNDRLDGGADEDVLDGGPGDDWLRGGGGWDEFRGGPGDDTIDAADGRGESVRCGAGNDVVRADRYDRLRACERVKLSRRKQ
jgi:Ca2+-binding RTX toxin-like protein